MFKDAKVGDKVWSVRHGWGEIIAVDGLGIPYPVRVSFCPVVSILFTISGKEETDDTNPTLFWDEVEIVAPPKPKPKIMVKHTVEMWVNVYSWGLGMSHLTEHGASAAADAKAVAVAVKLTGEYQVEE